HLHNAKHNRAPHPPQRSCARVPVVRRSLSAAHHSATNKRNAPVHREVPLTAGADQAATTVSTVALLFNCVLWKVTESRTNETDTVEPLAVAVKERDDHPLKRITTTTSWKTQLKTIATSSAKHASSKYHRG
ncbi:Hypothetical protein, putative, partial [Bodo saltans]